jgi:hypothetical protein
MALPEHDPEFLFLKSVEVVHQNKSKKKKTRKIFPAPFPRALKTPSIPFPN